MVYEGWICGVGVLVYDAESIQALFSQGFGKGILSRSFPNHFTAEKNKKYLPDKQVESREAFHAKFISSQVHEATGNEIEALQLNPVEAFYIKDIHRAFSIRLQSVGSSERDYNAPEVSVEELWSLFVHRLGKRFIAEYCCFCNYRNMGWIVKGGMKYGVDYLLYSKGGPELKHSQLAVSIHFIETLQSSKSIDVDRFQRMVQLQTLSRVTETVSKGLLLSIVYKKSSDILNQSNTTDDIYNPCILNSYCIKDFIINRWDPSKARE